MAIAPLPVVSIRNGPRVTALSVHTISSSRVSQTNGSRSATSGTVGPAITHGSPPLRRSQPSVAMHATATTTRALRVLARTIPSDRYRDTSKHPESDVAVLVEQGQATTFEPGREPLVQPVFQADGERRHSRRAQPGVCARGKDNGRPINPLLMTLPDATAEEISSRPNCHEDGAGVECRSRVQYTPVLKKVRSIEAATVEARNHHVGRGLQGVSLRQVYRDAWAHQRPHVQAFAQSSKGGQLRADLDWWDAD